MTSWTESPIGNAALSASLTTSSHPSRYTTLDRELEDANTLDMLERNMALEQSKEEAQPVMCKGFSLFGHNEPDTRSDTGSPRVCATCQGNKLAEDCPGSMDHHNSFPAPLISQYQHRFLTRLEVVHLRRLFRHFYELNLKEEKRERPLQVIRQELEDKRRFFVEQWPRFDLSDRKDLETALDHANSHIAQYQYRVPKTDAQLSHELRPFLDEAKRVWQIVFDNKPLCTICFKTPRDAGNGSPNGKEEEDRDSDRDPCEAYGNANGKAPGFQELHDSYQAPTPLYALARRLNRMDLYEEHDFTMPVDPSVKSRCELRAELRQAIDDMQCLLSEQQQC